ncbi:AAA family ATPase, partial [bacterium]|nr:AAA family ATPase [bacterium]
TQKILAQRDRIEGERKIVTVLFCDLVGYTKIAGSLDPEETFSLMDQVLEILIHSVHDYGGTVNQLLGDGLYALFGAPIALEDGPQRAIRSAMDMHRSLTRFSEKITQEKNISPLKLRIGINTGPVVVGTIGNSLRVDFTAIGDTVNLASRMEGLAEPGTIYVTEETFKLAEHFFRFEALGAKKVKGVDGPLKAYLVVGRSTRNTRFDVSAERGLTPLAGRERELEILHDCFERIKSGQGQAYSVVGDAGTGKSRLLYEFRKSVANEDVTILEGKCLSYAKNTAYRPVADLLKANFRIEDSDEEQVIQEKVIAGLNAIGADEASTLPYLLDLLGIKESGIKQLNITPELKKDRTIDSLQKIVVKGSELRPLIMIFEDLHWIDEPSEKLLNELLKAIPASRVLLLFSYRSEFVHTWGGKSYHSQINLNRLSNRESLFMLSHILKTNGIERDLAELVLSKSEGIPFYLEEFVKALKDLNVIEQRGTYRLVKEIEDLTIPSSIQDVIMARIDALPEGSREVLQVGSAIEREFSYQLLQQVMNIEEKDLLSRLSALKASELIYERGLYPDITCIFKHALTREVIYNSILSARKKNLHQNIGEAIEKLYLSKIKDHYEALADHFLKSEDYIRGSEYSGLASIKALQSDLSLDAINYAEKKVFCTEKLKDLAGYDTRIVEARVYLARAYLSRSLHIEAKEAVSPVVDAAVAMNHQRCLPTIYIVLGTHRYFIDEDYSTGFDYLKKALDISKMTGNYNQQWLANLYAGNNLAINCQFDESIVYFQDALKVAEKTNNKTLTCAIKAVLSFENYFWRGDMNRAYRISGEALALSAETATSTKGMAAFSFGVSCYGKGYFEPAEKHFSLAAEYLAESNAYLYRAGAYWNWGELSCHLKKYDMAQIYFEQGLSLFKEHDFMPGALTLMGLYLYRLEVIEGAVNMDIKQLVEHFQGFKNEVLLGQAALVIADILFRMNDHNKSETAEWFQKTIEMNSRNNTNFYLAQSHYLYSDFLKQHDNPSLAREQMHKAIETMQACGADGWVERYEKELADM